jgi:hypothetical protein
MLCLGYERHGEKRNIQYVCLVFKIETFKHRTHGFPLTSFWFDLSCLEVNYFEANGCLFLIFVVSLGLGKNGHGGKKEDSEGVQFVNFCRLVAVYGHGWSTLQSCRERSHFCTQSFC